MQERPRGVTARHALTGSLEGYDLVLLDTARSSSVAAEHRHPGPCSGTSWVVNCVLASTTRRRMSCRRAERSLSRPGAMHTTNESVDSDKPVRFLALFVVPTGSPLVGA